MAGKFAELAAVVVIIGGQSNDNEAALEAAIPIKNRGVDIICIGTDNADKDFLARLATRSDLATHVSAKELRATIRDTSRWLTEFRSINRVTGGTGNER